MRGFVRVIGSLGVDTAERLGAGLGCIAFGLGIRRRVVRENLRRTLGLRGRRRHEVARQSYATMGANFLALLVADRDPDEGLAGFASFAPRAFERLCERGNAVFVTAHLGSWDMGAAGVGRGPSPFVAYATPQHDPVADAEINRLRKALGFDVLMAFHGDRRAALKAIKLLRQGGFLALIADQGPPPERGTPNWFLGQATICHLGPAFFAQRAGVPVVVTACIRLRAGRYRIIHGRPFRVSDDQAEATAQILDQLSGLIARFPGQYFWHHRRFKYPADLPPRPSHPWKTRSLADLLANGGV
jgi:KDO2-lipid IV(A) lauroyltransferase